MLTFNTILILIPLLINADPSPIPLQWSDKTYGPDGPWNALRINVGSPNQAIDVFPYLQGSSTGIMLDSKICDQDSNSLGCADTQNRFFDRSASNTWKSLTSIRNINGSFSKYIPEAYAGDLKWGSDTINLGDIAIPDTEIELIEWYWQKVSAGPKQNQTLGSLGFGNVDLGIPPKVKHGTTNTLLNWLYDNTKIPSKSLGLHIGAAPVGIEGSLVVGGYDSNRIAGPVNSFPHPSHDEDDYPPPFALSLLDIGISAISGHEPPIKPARNTTGLLVGGHDKDPKNRGIDVTLDPLSSYLNLPNKTCQALASKLPIKHDSTLGIWLWDTSQDWEKVVNSPSYLTFELAPMHGKSESFEINVPFKLLNMTLTSPLVESPTPYFPCFNYDVFRDSEFYSLGGPFFHAAFIGSNYGDGSSPGNWFIAQAPGPNGPPGSSIKSIQVSDTSISGSEDMDWLDSWKGAWSESASSSEGNSGNSGGSGGKGNDGFVEKPKSLFALSMLLLFQIFVVF